MRNEARIVDGDDGTTPMMQAIGLTRAAAATGFDWQDIETVFDKLQEEIAELRQGLQADDPDNVAEEFGDILFVVANLGRKLGLDPDSCLRAANRKFARRFVAMRQSLPETGVSLDVMEDRWRAVKREEVADAAK